MELIFIDDGSTNQSCINTIKILENKYSNVKTYFFEPGGSGSASRARNKGVYLSSSKYICYLDPDNEAIGDGYYELYKCIKEYDVDFVIGNIKLKNSSSTEYFDYYKEFIKVNNNKSISHNGREILLKTNFLAQSIQACIINKEYLFRNNLEMVDGAIGEDTLFFYEMIAKSKKVMAIDEYIHIYNTDVDNSLTNSISTSYFKKHLIAEKAKAKFLKDFNLYNKYKENLHDYYINRWIKSKLELVPKDKLNECEAIVSDIEALYSYIFTIIIPVFNTKYNLLQRCFNSLLRNTLFDKLEILIIDDGSDNIETIEYIKKLDSTYNNVKTYFFEQGGSGSASRPRNKGIKLSTTNYITFLDPDNEAFKEGYTELYEKMIKHKGDLIVGNIYFDDDKSRRINDYYTTALSVNPNTNIINDTRNLLIKSDFMAQSIQACLISKQLITENNLSMVEGSIGEDTLFFYELVLNAKKMLITDSIIHIYHRNNFNSILNKIDITYFEKILISEIEKNKLLKKSNLLDDYLKIRYRIHLNDYILSKVEYLNQNDRSKAEKIINTIENLNKNKL